MFGCWTDDNLGYDPQYGGLAVNYLPDGSRICYQGGNIVSCEDESVVYGKPGLTNGSGAGPLPPTNMPPPRTPEDLAACQAYVVKYRRVFGRDPVGIWCLSTNGTPANDTPVGPPPPVKALQPLPVFQPPIVREPPPSPPSTSNIYRHWGWRRRKPPVKRPYVEKPKPVPLVEICPIRGYTSRVIPGANEYQNFRCTPGQPVVIDEGLQRAGAADAYARHGMTSALGDVDQLGALMIGNIAIPTWALFASAGLLALMFLKKGRR